LRRQDVAMLQLFDVPLLVEQTVYLGAGHAEGWALHFVLGIVKRDEQTGAARRQLQVHVDGEPFAHPCGHCDQRSAVVEGLALRDHLGVDFKHVAVDDFDLTAGRVGDVVVRAFGGAAGPRVQLVLGEEGLDRDRRHVDTEHPHALLRQPQHVQRLAAQRHQHARAARHVQRGPVLHQQRHHFLAMPAGAPVAPAFQPVLGFHRSLDDVRGGVCCASTQISSSRTLPVASSYSAPTTCTRPLFTASAMIGCAEATRETLYATFASIARSSNRLPPPFTTFSIPGRTASVMSQMWPGNGFGFWISWIAALTAPQLLWPSTINSGVPSTPTPYSRLDSASRFR